MEFDSLTFLIMVIVLLAAVLASMPPGRLVRPGFGSTLLSLRSLLCRSGFCR